MGIRKLLILLIFGLSVSPVLAISDLTFTTEPQVVAPASISGGLSVSSGEAIGQTSDLFLTSSSATGEFSSSATNWQVTTKITWNSNWSNRTFYYRDSTAGTPTITATLTTRDGAQSWSASQTITVGEGGGVSLTSGDSSDEETSDSSSATSATPAKSSTNSASVIKVSIGEKRVATVNAPVNFKVKATGVKKGDSLEHNWSFGDGATALGVKVTHVYEYPGLYTVVLNSRRGEDDEEASAKTEVEVIAPDVRIADVASDGAYIKLANNSAKAVNLGLWRLSAGGRDFLLPRDTMIAPRATLTLSRGVTNLWPQAGMSVQLLYPTGALFTTRDWPSQQVASSQKSPELAQAVSNLEAKLVKKSAAKPVQKMPKLAPVEPVSKTVTLGVPTPKPWWQKIFSR